MSTDKRNWWDAVLRQPRPGELKQTRKAALHHVMNTTPRPSNPNEAIEYRYTTNNKFHDREPGVIVDGLLVIDPHFFDTYPRRKGTKLDRAYMGAIIGEAARAFYRHGLAAYGKPDLRKPSGNLSTPISSFSGMSGV